MSPVGGRCRSQPRQRAAQPDREQDENEPISFVNRLDYLLRTACRVPSKRVRTSQQCCIGGQHLPVIGAALRRASSEALQENAGFENFECPFGSIELAEPDHLNRCRPVKIT